MTSKELRKKFLDFFEKRGHAIVPSSSLIPDDQSVLLTTAGMQQFVPYLSGEVKPPYQKACSVQKCFRVKDLDEVGDDTHHTFFEMLGNWSFGSYFKKEAIAYALEFLDECGIPRNKLAITIFKGEKGIARDEEAYNLWLENGFAKKDIFEFGMKDNFWGPTAATGPCGPCSEIHYDKTGKSCGEGCGPNCSCGRYVEVWNLVFMEYLKDGDYHSLPQKNIDTGIGFERLLAILNNKESAYETDLFEDLMDKEISDERLRRIFADHSRASCFLIADGVVPSNVERGYVLRRLLRRMIGQEKILGIDVLENLVGRVVEKYSSIYPELKTDIMTVVNEEKEKFGKTIERGIKEFEKIIKNRQVAIGVKPGTPSPDVSKIWIISGEEAFNLFSTYGLPLDMIKDLAQKEAFKVDEEGFEEAFKVDEEGFEKRRKEHQKLSRAGAEKKFGGHGLGEARVFEKGDEEKVKKLHTATHLLHQALFEILGPEVKQMGSDITPERLRFDFSYSQKMTPEQIKEVEEIVNQKIKENLPVKCEEMDKEKAMQSGAKAFFKGKYGDKVKVYSIDDFSKEICAGPHVDRTGELGKFKIVKEQSSSAGVRRIKAVLE